MLIGSRRLFEFARENPLVRLRSSEHTHGPRALAAIERFVAINSAVEVDFTGQVNSEVANGSYVGNFRKVTAPSPTKLVIELKKPQATMAALDVPIRTLDSLVGIESAAPSAPYIVR